jgi:hypothetical protein
MPTTVVNRMHTQIYDVYIGRPSKWGNPFKIGGAHPVTGRPMTRTDVIDLYEQHLLQSPTLLRALPEVRGKILGCWCPPKACHGHVIARYADWDTTNTCPDCHTTWTDPVPTIGLLHRLRLCADCYQLHQHGSDHG